MQNDYYKDFFFLDFFKTLGRLVSSPAQFFKEVSLEKRTKKVAPGSYVLLSYGIFFAMTLWGGNFTTEATWADADFESFEANEIQKFNSKLKLTPIDARNIQLQVVTESTRPCMSPISLRITETIGSCKLPDIAKYFQRIGEHSISSKLYKSYSEYKDRQQKLEFLQVLFMPIAIGSFAAIFHYIANKKKVASFEVSKAAHSYYWGTMLFVATGFITIYSMMLNQSTTYNLIGQSIWLMIPVVVWCYYVLRQLGSSIYGASFTRTLWSFMVSGTASKLLVLGLTVVSSKLLP